MSARGTLVVRIENVYEDGEEVETVVTIPDVELPEHAGLDGADLDEWAEDVIYPHTGTGRTDGDAGYFATITDAPAPWLVGQTFEWGL